MSDLGITGNFTDAQGRCFIASREVPFEVYAEFEQAWSAVQQLNAAWDREIGEVRALRQRVAALEGDVRTWRASAELHGKRAAKAEGRAATLEGAMRDHDDCRVCRSLLDPEVQP